MPATRAASHLRQRNGWWYYYRRRPKRYASVESQPYISEALFTQDVAEARVKAAKRSLELDAIWQKSLVQGKNLRSEQPKIRHDAVCDIQKDAGFEPKPADDFTDQEFVTRLRWLIQNPCELLQKQAIMGVVEVPDQSLDEAFEEFWQHIKEEWMDASHDQKRVKRNVYLKSLRHFKEAVGDVPFNKLERRHALRFREWWTERIEANNFHPDTANRELNSLRRMVNVIYDRSAELKPNPFARVRLKAKRLDSRMPMETKQIHKLLAFLPDSNMHIEFQNLFLMLINTGLRPVEAIGLELSDFEIEHDVPHVIIRANEVRKLKTDHSERKIPLVGVSLKAARSVYAKGGWINYGGKNMYATSKINRFLRESEIGLHKKQSLYSLRHWFQDQLTKANVVDRAQAQLMGHKFDRPKYGQGKTLADLREIIAGFAI